jgi:hypothetical protein
MTGRERILVPFAGAGSGVAELSWGQREIWHAMVNQGSWFPLGGVKPLPPGSTVADVAATLAFIMSRFQTARTRLRFAATGSDGSSGPWQVVSASGEAPLEIVDAGAADPAEIAEQVRARFCADDFDFATDWPVRMAAIRSGTDLTQVVMIFCHLVTDAFGWLTLRSELQSPTRPVAPITALQPLEQARWQQSPAGQRQNANALRYWEATLRTMPTRQFAETGAERDPRYWHGTIDSPATHLAVRAIAARTRVDAAAVLLALAAVAVGRLTGLSQVALRPIVSNRFQPGLAGSVSPVNQGGLCLVDVGGVSVDEAVQRTWRRSLAAYRFAYCDPEQRNALIARIGRERGVDLDLSCYVNDRRAKVRHHHAGSAPTPDQISEALPRTTFRWSPEAPTRERFFLHIEDVPDTFAAILSADTRYLTPSDIEGYLRSIEAVAVAAALDPAAGTGIPATLAEHGRGQRAGVPQVG